MADEDGAASALLGAGAPRGYAACGAKPAWPARGVEGWREAAKALLSHAWFEPLMVAISVLDAAAVGLEIDHPQLGTHGTWLAVTVGFNLLFTAEEALRLAAHGFVALYDWMHLALSLVTALAWLELSLSAAGELGLMPGPAMAVLVQVPGGLVQVMRILRAGRLAALVEDCRVVMRSLAFAVQELCWVLVLLLLLFLLVACAVTLVIGRKAGESAGATAEAMGNFSSVGASMFALLELALMEGWPDLVRPMLDEHWEFVPPLLAFIFVANCGLLNLSTAVVVEGILQASKQETEWQQQRQKAEERELMAALHSQLSSFNGGPEISRERFEAWLDRNDGAGTMAQLDFSKAYMLSAYSLCDQEQHGKVSLNRLKQVWEDSKVPLTMARCISYRHQLVARLEHLERLNSVVLGAVQKLAIQKAKAAGTGA